jgi:acetyl-CoA carboxylase biotin carboxyl carrier protein
MTEQFILTLIDKFENGAMRELELADGESRLVLSKNTAARPQHGQAAPNPPQNPPAAANIAETAPLSAAPSGTGGSGAAQTAQNSAAPKTICAPIVGTFYAAPGPDAPAFVRKGDKVSKGDAVCILEAMKMMNKLEAEFNCEILEIKAAPGELVEFGQVLFEVRPL